MLWTHRLGAKNTLIEATVEKIHLPKDLLIEENIKLFSFMSFNYIITYIRYFINTIYGIKSNLDSNYETKVKQIIFYLQNPVA